jgi:hypothetical protein
MANYGKCEGKHVSSVGQGVYVQQYASHWVWLAGGATVLYRVFKVCRLHPAEERLSRDSARHAQTQRRLSRRP